MRNQEYESNNFPEEMRDPIQIIKGYDEETPEYQLAVEEVYNQLGYVPDVVKPLERAEIREQLVEGDYEPALEQIEEFFEGETDVLEEI